MSERDFETHPYSADEERVAAWMLEQNPDVGAGNDPIGFLIAAYGMLVAQRDWQSTRNDQLIHRLTHLQTAIATHHATKHGSEPATARSVRSPVDRTLYEAAGTPHAVLAWDAGRDVGGDATKGES